MAMTTAKTVVELTIKLAPHHYRGLKHRAEADGMTLAKWAHDTIIDRWLSESLASCREFKKRPDVQEDLENFRRFAAEPDDVMWARIHAMEEEADEAR